MSTIPTTRASEAASAAAAATSRSTSAATIETRLWSRAAATAQDRSRPRPHRSDEEEAEAERREDREPTVATRRGRRRRSCESVAMPRATRRSRATAAWSGRRRAAASTASGTTARRPRWARRFPSPRWQAAIEAQRGRQNCDPAPAAGRSSIDPGNGSPGPTTQRRPPRAHGLRDDDHGDHGGAPQREPPTKSPTPHRGAAKREQRRHASVSPTGRVAACASSWFAW